MAEQLCKPIFSGVCWATPSTLPYFKRNCWLCAAATVALCAPSNPFTTLSHWPHYINILLNYFKSLLHFKSHFPNLCWPANAQTKHGNTLHPDVPKSNAVKRQNCKEMHHDWCVLSLTAVLASPQAELPKSTGFVLDIHSSLWKTVSYHFTAALKPLSQLVSRRCLALCKT